MTSTERVDGMILLEELTELIYSEKWKAAWEHLLSLLPGCDFGYHCDNIATHRRQSSSRTEHTYACEACIQSDPDEAEGWEAVPWIAHVVAYRLTMMRPAKGRAQQVVAEHEVDDGDR
jgi:hypothetical protein